MRKLSVVFVIIMVCCLFGCNTYKAQPLSFKAPASYENSVEAVGAIIAAKAYADPKEAEATFGFDIRKAGLLPVLVVFDNQGGIPLRINGEQTFLEDQEGNIWPVLADKIAYERVTKYADTEEIFKSAGKSGLLGVAAGALIGAAVGVVTGDSVGKSIGKGAVIGGAAGATLGGASKLDSDEANDAIIDDLESKTLENKAIPGQGLAYGYIFFPGEAVSVKVLRLQLKTEGPEPGTHVLHFPL